MPFLIRPSRHFPVCCPVTYQCTDFEGHGTVWNLSLTGWRFSGEWYGGQGASAPCTPQ